MTDDSEFEFMEPFHPSTVEENCFSEDSYEFAKSSILNDVYCENSASVKGRLKRAIKEWESIQANEFVIQCVNEGYKIPFASCPPPLVKDNNRSAFSHAEFVNEALSELLLDGRIEEVFEIPDIINPLSVSVQSSGKKRLILDLRHINLHVFKQKFKCEDLSTLREISKVGFHFFTFDLKSGYHHLDIFPEHRKFLSFSWNLHSLHPRYFHFTVLPFGLSSAPFIFTKLLRPLVKYWRSLGIPMVVYLDDGIGGSDSYESAAVHGDVVRTTLCKLGFMINEEKSSWVPSRVTTWLGCVIDSNTGTIRATQRRIDKLQGLLGDLCLKLEGNPHHAIFVHVKSLASIVGGIISLTRCCGNVTRIMTRYLHFVIHSRDHWNSMVPLDISAQREIRFWNANLERLNGASFWENPSVPIKGVYSDASNFGCGAHVSFDNHIFQTNWSSSQSEKSSTWRELCAVHLGLSSYIHMVKGHRLAWYTDSQNVVSIIEYGSKVRELQDLALDIFLLCFKYEVRLVPYWIPRDQNTVADSISRIIDFDDYTVKDEVFCYLDGIWGPHTIDRFACYYNTKLPRFNSRYFQPGSEAVDAFQQDWRFELNWLVPPISMIGKVIAHMRSCGARGTLLVPLWRSAFFWVLLCIDGVHWNSFIHDWVVLSGFSEVFVQGRAKNSLFGSNPAKHSPVVALFIDFGNPPRDANLMEFCTKSTLGCAGCRS